MKPQELFGVVIRTIGLLLSLSSLWFFFMALLSVIGGGPVSPIGLIIYGIPTLFVGVWFLGGAPLIVSLAYQQELEREQRGPAV